jgi:hypothetical protein
MITGDRHSFTESSQYRQSTDGKRVSPLLLLKFSGPDVANGQLWANT